MKKNIWIYLLLLIISSCGPYPPCEPIIVDNGKLPDSMLLLVPYKNGQIIKLQHSAGYIINFNSIRSTKTEHIMDIEGCNETIIESNNTSLTPDYPIFNITMGISNFDTINFNCSVVIGNYFIDIPTTTKYISTQNFSDSMFINNKLYKKVFKLRTNRTTSDHDSIYTDSLFYNYEFGILQIKMSNGEKYTRYE